MEGIPIAEALEDQQDDGLYQITFLFSLILNKNNKYR